MKKSNRLLFWAVIMFGVVAIGRLTTNASEIDMQDGGTTVEQEASTEQETGKENDTETVMEATEELGDDNHITAGGNEEAADAVKSSSDNEISDEADKENAIDNIENDVEAQDMEEEALASDSLYYQGLKYYCSKYQYECEIVYLEKYLEYIALEEEAGKEIYNMGEMTAADLKSYEAQQASIEAQIKVAENQREYYNLFLKENNLDYSDYSLKDKKDVNNLDYYLEQYPTKNHMTIAGYVMSYNNALAYIEAKKVELDALTMKLDSAKLLYEAGEISKLEWKQQETAVAKAQYELEQYYVEMNLAYVNLMSYCN